MMSNQTVNTKKSLMWEKTIFAQFKNSKLKNELMKWAKIHQLDVVWESSKHFNLIACPCFAIVIDRNLIIENQIYSQYLSHIHEVNSDCEFDDMRNTCICIIIDNIKDLELPLLDVVLQVDINHKNTVKFILHNLELASKLVVGTSDKYFKAVDKYLKKEKGLF
ncbi:MAG: hypothetical protein NUV58_04750 [Candidatus Roizmanbacteria bacterium]|nr:hypothetical protein [Candidatus Roizmanbacteria bacterium]